MRIDETTLASFFTNVDVNGLQAFLVIRPGKAVADEDPSDIALTYLSYHLNPFSSKAKLEGFLDSLTQVDVLRSPSPTFLLQ